MYPKHNPRRFILCFAVAFLVLPAYHSPVGALEESQKDWSRPDRIDPLRSDIGDFLDIDLVSYVRQARELFVQRKFEEAAQHYLFVLRHKYDDAASIYNLACCYGHMRKAERAAQFLDRAVRAGFQDFEQIETDPSFQTVRGNGEFKRIMKKIEAWKIALGEMVYVESTKLTKVRIRFPEGYDPHETYPLVIGLHGNGGNSEGFVTLWEDVKDRDFIYAAPEAPYVRPDFIGRQGEPYSWSILHQNERLQERARKMTEDYILEVADRISSIYYVSDIYLLGFSQGAGYSYLTGIKHPDIFKGIICLSGHLPETILSADYDKARPKLKVFIAHGKQERSHEEGIKARKHLEQLGFDVTFSDFDGGHEVSLDILKQVSKWMKNVGQSQG